MRLLLDQLLYLFFLSHLLLLSNAAFLIAPPTSPITAFNINMSSFFETSLNTTTLGSINPNNFRTKITYGLRPLPANSVLMIAVDALVELALQDWEGQMSAKTFKLDEPRYSHVEMRISPSDSRPGATMKPAFAVFGLFNLMVHMLSNPAQRFRTAECSFLYDGQAVGQLSLIPNVKSKVPLEGIASSDATLPSISPSISSLPSTQYLTSNGRPGHGNAATLSAPSWSDPHLSLSFFRGREFLTINEAFFGIIILLSQLAPLPANDSVQHFTLLVKTAPVTSGDSGLTVYFENAGNPRRTAEDTPYFKWEWLIKALGRLPALMLDERDLRDFFLINLKVDEVWVGKGYILRHQGAARADALANA